MKAIPTSLAVLAMSLSMASCKTTAGSVKSDVSGDTGNARPLLSGFNAQTGRFTGNVCVSSPTQGQRVPDQREEITFAPNLSSEDILQTMAGDLSLTFAQTGGLNSASGAKFAKEAGADDYSLSYTLIVRVKASSLNLELGGDPLALTPFGAEVSQLATDALGVDPDRRKAAWARIKGLGFSGEEKAAVRDYVLSNCGDQIVDSIGYGAQYYATLKIVAANRSERDIIKRGLSVKSSGLDIDGDLVLNDERVKKNLFVSMHVLQIGGNPSAALKSISTEALACNKDSFDACIKAFKQVFLYATGGKGQLGEKISDISQVVNVDFSTAGFPSQLNEANQTGLVTTGYRTRPYKAALIDWTLGTTPLKGRVVARRLEGLNSEYKIHANAYQRADILLKNFSVGEQQAALSDIRDRTMKIQDEILRVFVDCKDNETTCPQTIDAWDLKKTGKEYLYDKNALSIIAGTFLDYCQQASSTVLALFEVAGQQLGADSTESCVNLETALKPLRELNLSGRNLENIEPLIFLNTLQTLNLSRNRVLDIAALSKIPLRTLVLSQNPVRDLSPLAQSISISSLTVGDSLVSDLGTLTGNTSLASLSLESAADAKSKSVNLAGYRGTLTKLKTLNLKGYGTIDGLDQFIGYSYDGVLGTFAYNPEKRGPGGGITTISISSSADIGGLSCDELSGKIKAAWADYFKSKGLPERAAPAAVVCVI